MAIIMDGNGRWAASRGLPRSAGHAAGAAAVEPIVRAAPSLGIERLTLFALSADNWNRPESEVDAILELLISWLDARRDACRADGVRLSVIGRRDRLPDRLVEAIERAEALTAGGTRLHVRVAVDYSARDAILRAARWFNVHAAVDGTHEGFGRVLALACHGGSAPFDVDLLVRSGGEQRLSDFLLWECAYAELVFSPRPWPDFDADELARAVEEFHRRERRFGRLPAHDSAARDVG